MWSFYVFMTWFLIITLWKNIIGAIFAKIWSVVMFFGHTAQKPKHPSQDEADCAHKLEHSSQDEADSTHEENVPDHEDLKMFLAKLSDINHLLIKICAHSRRWQFIFKDFNNLEQTGDHTTYFAVLDHISSSMTIKSLRMRLEDNDQSLGLMSKHRRKKLLDYLEAFSKAVASNRSLEDVDFYLGSLHHGEFISRDKNAADAKDLHGILIANGIAKVLNDNKTILSLGVEVPGALCVEAARILNRALSTNQTLKTLMLDSYSSRIVNICGESMEILLEPLSGKGGICNSVLEHLSLTSMPTDDNGVEHIAAMLMVNDSIKRFSFHRARADGQTQNGISKIGDALSVNRTLQELELYHTAIH